MFLGNVLLFIPNQKRLGGKTLKMKLSRSTLGTFVAAGIKPATSWFEGLPLCSLAQQQHNTKELAELFFHFTTSAVRCESVVMLKLMRLCISFHP